MPPWAIAVLILAGLFLVLTLVLLALSIRIVPQADFWIVERLGKYLKTWKGGLHIKVPMIDYIVFKENLKEKVIDFPSQSVITKDNVTMKVNTVTYLQIMDPKKYHYGVENAISAIENLVATTLRNFLGNITVDETLTSRTKINLELTQLLDEASDSWGVKVNRVELKEIMPPTTILQAMEKLLQAERDKTAMITESEGIRDSQIARATGEARAKILIAEAERDRLVLEAEGKKKYVELLASAQISPQVLQWLSLDKIDALANGNATKIIIPPDLSSVAKIMAAVDAFSGKK